MSEQNQTTYFDVITRGHAKLTRARTVTADKSRGQKFQPFDAVTLVVLVGDHKNPVEHHIDCKVVGPNAKEWMQENINNIDEKAIFKFQTGDIRAELFTYPQGHSKEGQEGICMKANLLSLAPASEIPEHYALETRARAYLNVRKLSESSDAISVAMMSGPSDSLEKTKVDCMVANDEVNAMITALKPDALAGTKITCTVTLNDMEPKTFKLKSGENSGKTIACLKSKLTGIVGVKVDGHPFTMPEEPELQATGTTG